MQDLWQNAFICLGNWGCIKFSLLLFLITVALLVCLYAKDKNEKNKKNGIINPIKIWKNLRPGEQNEIIIIIAVYVLILLAVLLPSKPIQILSFLTKPAEGFLAAEPLIWIVEILLVIGSALIKGSKWEYLNTVNAVARILIFVSVASTILIQQGPLCWYNILWFLAVGALLVCLKLLSMMQPSKFTTEHGLYEPISRYDDLFPPRQKQADELCRIIGRKTSSGISICVAGPWGSGKTSLVLGTCDKLQKDKNTRGYEYIFLHAMELDSLSSLFSYLFSRIREILKVRGGYVGLGSEYRRLIASAGGMITSSQFSNVLERKLFYEEEDYRSQLKRLEAMMKDVLDDDKLVIVVDDVERCDPEKAREFLYFVKEIATMECCVSIFITDDKFLPVPQHVESEKDKFFDKFFNFRMVVSPLSLENIMGLYEKEKKIPKQNLKVFFLDSPKTVYLELRKRLQDQAKPIKVQHQESIEEQQKEEEEEKQRQAYLLQCVDRLTESLSRPRTLIKFYQEYSNSFEKIQEYYQSTDLKLLEEYFATLKISELLFLLAYLKTCFPEEQKEIQKRGFRTYLDQARISMDEPKRFLGKMMQDILFQDYLIFTSFTYQNEKRIRFLDTFLTQPEQLPNIVDGFTSQEREWFSNIEQDNEKAMEDHWNEMLLAVVEQYSNLNKASRYLERLAQFAAKQVAVGNWSANTPLEVLEKIESEHVSLFSACHVVPLVSVFDRTFSGEVCLKGLSKQTERWLRTTAPVYFQIFCLPIIHLLKCVFPWEYDSVRDIPVKSAEDEYNITYLVTRFLNEIRLCDFWKYRLPQKMEGLGALHFLLNDVQNLLKKENRWGYPDIQDMFQQASEALLELQSLSHLLAQVHQICSQESGDDQLNFTLENLPGIINYMEKRLKQTESLRKKKVIKNFQDAFYFIKACKPNEISKENLRRLQNIVTEYYKQQPDMRLESACTFREILVEKEVESDCYTLSEK